MYYILATEFNIADYIPVIIQVLVTAGVIFGGTGYWQYKQAKEQAKRDEQSKENGIEKKMDALSDNVSNLGEKVSSLDSKVDNLSEEVQGIKNDIMLLQQANEETVKYRLIRDASDKESLQVQQAVIESLKGLMRERLLDEYNRCIKKGYYTKEEREVYKPLYECYIHDPFRGNGVIGDLHDIMVRLPMTPEKAGIMNDEDSVD